MRASVATLLQDSSLTVPGQCGPQPGTDLTSSTKRPAALRPSSGIRMPAPKPTSPSLRTMRVSSGSAARMACSASIQRRVALPRFTHDPGAPSSLSNNTVNTVHVDRSGAVWVGTQNGLNLARPVERHPSRSYYEKDGLAGSAVSCILEDGRRQPMDEHQRRCLAPGHFDYGRSAIIRRLTASPAMISPVGTPVTEARPVRCSSGDLRALRRSALRH